MITKTSHPRSAIRLITTVVVVLTALTAVSLAEIKGQGEHQHGTQSETKPTKDLGFLFGNHECPVTGESVDPDSFVELKDEEKGVFGRVYLCCDGCKKKASKKIGELYKRYYMTDKKTGKEKKEPLDLANTVCPMSGESIKQDNPIQYNGMVVHFCCADCAAEFLKSPDEKLVKLVPEPKEFKYKRPAGSSHAHH